MFTNLILLSIETLVYFGKNIIMYPRHSCFRCFVDFEPPRADPRCLLVQWGMAKVFAPKDRTSKFEPTYQTRVLNPSLKLYTTPSKISQNNLEHITF